MGRPRGTGLSKRPHPGMFPNCGGFGRWYDPWMDETRPHLRRDWSKSGQLLLLYFHEKKRDIGTFLAKSLMLVTPMTPCRRTDFLNVPGPLEEWKQQILYPGFPVQIGRGTKRTWNTLDSWGS